MIRLSVKLLVGYLLFMSLSFYLFSGKGGYVAEAGVVHTGVREVKIIKEVNELSIRNWLKKTDIVKIEAITLTQEKLIIFYTTSNVME